MPTLMQNFWEALAAGAYCASPAAGTSQKESLELINKSSSETYPSLKAYLSHLSSQLVKLLRWGAPNH